MTCKCHENFQHHGKLVPVEIYDEDRQQKVIMWVTRKVAKLLPKPQPSHVHK